MKYTIEDIRKEYDRLDKLCGIDSSGITIRINNAVKRLGSFSAVKKPGIFSAFMKPELTITISQYAMQSEKLFYDTVRHEYAHAVVYLLFPGERHGHDKVWKSICRKINCTPRATVKNEQITENLNRKYKYVVKCNHCGRESYYLHAGKIVKALKCGNMSYMVRCRICGSNDFTLLIK